MQFSQNYADPFFCHYLLCPIFFTIIIQYFKNYVHFSILSKTEKLDCKRRNRILYELLNILHFMRINDKLYNNRLIRYNTAIFEFADKNYPCT